MLINHFFNKNGEVISYILIMVSLLYARDIMHVAVDKNVFIPIVLGYSLFSGFNNLIKIILFTLPLMCGLPGNFFLPIWCVLVGSHLYRNKALSTKAVLFCTIICLWEIVIYSMYDYSVVFTKVMGYFSALILVSILISSKLKMDYKQHVFFFCLGCCILLLAILMMYLKDPTLWDSGIRMGGEKYNDLEEMTLRTNPNNVAYLSVTSISLLYALYYYKKINIVIFGVLLVASFFPALYSASRTWAISMVLIVAFYMFFSRTHKAANFFVIFLVVGVVILFLIYNTSFWELFVGRFEEDNFSTAGQRTILFKQYNDFLLNHPYNFFWGTSAQLYFDVTGLYHSTHNGLQQIWLSYGILGFLLFLIAFYRVSKVNYQSGQIMSLLPLLLILFFIQTIQLLNPHSEMYPLIPAFFVMKMVKQQTVKKLS